MFENYSPQDLRDAIELEMSVYGITDPKSAAAVAIKKLSENPAWYRMNKARDISKLTKKVVTDKTGVRRTVYVKVHEDEKKKDNWLNGIMSFFGFSDKKQVFQKLDRDYKEHDIGRKFNLTWDGWKAHVGEYFANKAKWDNFFAGKKVEKKETEKKEKKEKAENDKKKKTSGLRLSVMKEIFAMYSGAKPEPVAQTPVEKPVEKPVENNFDTMPESEKNGAKIEANVKITPKQEKEIIDNDQIEAREGYFNEKPSEILNVGQDVWGAARHKYDTYEKADANVSVMETDGTAVAFVTKKNILGKYSLNDEDTKERVSKGETPGKVLASFAVKEYLEKIPLDSPESRKNYMDFCRAIIRLDDNTNTSRDFIQGLALSAKNIFGLEVGKVDKAKEKAAWETIGYSLFAFLNLISNGGGATALRYAQMTANSAERKKITNLVNTYLLEKDQGTYDQIKKDILGATKASGISIKKGDEVIFTDNLKDKVYVLKMEYDNDAIGEKVREERQRYYKLQYNMNFPSFLESKSAQYQKAILDEHSLFWGQKITSIEQSAKLKEEEVKRISEFIEANEKRVKYFPQKTGQVIKAGKDKVLISFEFPDGKIRSFEFKPSDLSQENIQSQQKEKTTKVGGKLNLYVESQVTRKGGKDYSNISVTEAQKLLKDQYGFKALQYGNSMPADEREYHTKWTLQSFSDLSEILNLPVQQVTVNGKLGMAFGARGTGAAGGVRGVVAHYESGTKMINLTRSNGYGSLAHEWGHFLDNILTKNMKGFCSEDTSYIEKKANRTNIKHGSIVERSKRRGKGFDRYFYDENAKNKEYPFALLNSGQTKPDKDSRYYGFNDYQNGKDLDVKEPDNSDFAKKMQEIAELSQKDFKDKYNKLPDDSITKMILSMQGKEEYFNRPEECFARSFESYIADKLEDSGRMNTYLASKKKTGAFDDGELIYCQGETRSNINKLFDEFFDMIRGSEDLKKAVSRFAKLFDGNKKTYRKVK